MRYSVLGFSKHETILISRVLLVLLLFVIFGWGKLMGFSGAVVHLASLGRPWPMLGVSIAVAMELLVGLAIVTGVYTRPFALLLAIYALSTALIGQRFWTMSGTYMYESEIAFFKNVSIMGGLLLLCVTGPGKYSLDRR